jgi:tetratricopeptide (TPR) repeat protein
MKYCHAFCIAVILMLPSPAFAAGDPLAGIRELLLSGRYKEARAQLVTARDTFIAQANAPGEAAAWLLLGAADSSLNDTEAARSELEQAAAKFMALDDPFTAWLSIHSLAELERLEGRTVQSIAAHERGLALLQKAAEQSRFSVSALRVLGPVFGMPVEMLGPLEQYPDVLKPIMLRLSEVLARDGYSRTLMDAGQLEKAEEQLTQASAAASMFFGMFDTPIATHIGDLRQRQWRLEEARDSYLKALNASAVTRAMSLGDPQAEVSIFNRLAELELLCGGVDEALTWNDRALKLIHELNQPRQEAQILEARGDLLQKAGRFDAAIAVYEEVLNLPGTKDDLWRQASIHSDLGSLHMYHGTFGTSARHLEKAIELYQRLKAPLVEAPLWILLAEVDTQLGLNENASEALANARALAKKSGFTLAAGMADVLTEAGKVMAGHGSIRAVDEAIETLRKLPEARDIPLLDGAMQVIRESVHGGKGIPLNLESIRLDAVPLLQSMPLMLHGKLLFDRGDRAGARAVWIRALETSPQSDLRAGLFALIGVTHWLEGSRAEAIQNFTNAAAALEVSVEDVKVEEMLAGYLAGDRRVYYGLLIDMLLKESRWDEAFAQAERARARAFLQMVGNHRFNAERGADPRLVREAEILRTEIAARERRANEAPSVDAVRLRADVDLARQRYKTLLTRVKVTNPEYASLTNVEPLRLEDVRKELPADTTLISYFVSPQEVHAWVVHRGGAHYALLPLDRDGLRRLVCWAEAFGPQRNPRGVRVPGTCDDAATAEDAFDQLIAPLLGTIGQRKLVLIPHGLLHYVPFAALRNRANGHFLIEDFTLTYAPSASALRFLRAKESPVDGEALVLGDPDTPLPKLPGAGQEATAVARMLTTTLHLGAGARESLLKDLHGKVDLVHLAAHGVYDPLNPLFSKIALAPGGTDDGSLTVEDILSSVDLTGVNLVVLSACQSAVGARSGGDEIVGLTRALLYAGAPGVISTLWNIDDAASAGLMEEFYRRLTSGASVAEALRQAQLAVKEHYPDPEYWAAFMLTGDPQGRWKRAE